MYLWAVEVSANVEQREREGAGARINVFRAHALRRRVARDHRTVGDGSAGRGASVVARKNDAA